ncbi:MAG: lytic transglycosylase domain-containing protein [Phyllobacterium sp.]
MKPFFLLLFAATLSGIALDGWAGTALAEDGADEPVRITVAQSTAVAATRPPAATAGCRFDAGSDGEADARQGEAIIRKIAAQEDFDAGLLLAIARQESGLRLNSVSSAGAVGLMQLMPGTARRFEVDICDPQDNVRGAIRYLRLLQKRYRNPIYVLAAYNAGEDAVEKSRGIPLYAETVRYVAAVLTDLQGWQPLPASAARGRADDRDTDNRKPDDNPETWTQGFVLHVEQ